MTTTDENGSLELANLRTRALLTEIGSRVERLAEKQLELAKAELRAELHQEAGVLRGLGIAAVAALAGVILLLVTSVFALSTLMPAWLAGLAVSGAVLLAAAIIGLISWQHRVRQPLPRSREALKDDVNWIKERMA